MANVWQNAPRSLTARFAPKFSPLLLACPSLLLHLRRRLVQPGNQLRSEPIRSTRAGIRISRAPRAHVSQIVIKEQEAAAFLAVRFELARARRRIGRCGLLGRRLPRRRRLSCSRDKPMESEQVPLERAVDGNARLCSRRRSTRELTQRWKGLQLWSGGPAAAGRGPLLREEPAEAGKVRGDGLRRWAAERVECGRQPRQSRLQCEDLFGVYAAVLIAIVQHEHEGGALLEAAGEEGRDAEQQLLCNRCEWQEVRVRCGQVRGDGLCVEGAAAVEDLGGCRVEDERRAAQASAAANEPERRASRAALDRGGGTYERGSPAGLLHRWRGCPCTILGMSPDPYSPD